jgi:D-3-phosphoglycerate dehydrogenase
MKKIAITTTTFGEYDNSQLELCQKKGFEVVLNPYRRKVSSDELVELAKDAVGIIAGTEQMTEDIILKLPDLKVISRCGAGLDNVDLEAAKRRRIKTLNTPDAPVLAVAELTVLLILSLLRKVCQMDRELHEEQWQKRMGSLLCGKKIGIKGFGRVGKKVAELLSPFGCEIAYADPFVENGLLGLNCLSLEDLFSWADIITVHVSVSEKLIGEREFQLMKKGAYIINTSRGGVIDELVLYKYLTNGYLSGAALDVFEREPYTGPLKELDNVILTPHIGSYAKEARIEMERQAVENLLKGLRDCEIQELRD